MSNVSLVEKCKIFASITNDDNDLLLQTIISLVEDHIDRQAKGDYPVTMKEFRSAQIGVETIIKNELLSERKYNNVLENSDDSDDVCEWLYNTREECSKIAAEIASRPELVEIIKTKAIINKLNVKLRTII